MKRQLETEMVLRLALFCCPETEDADDDPIPSIIKNKKGNKKMDFEEFKEQFAEDVKNDLEGKGIECHCKQPMLREPGFIR